MMKKIAALLGVLSLICLFTACTPESPPVDDLTKGDRFNVDYSGVETDAETAPGKRRGDRPDVCAGSG